MKTIKSIFTSPIFWLGICLGIIAFISIISPAPKPLTEAEIKASEEMLIQFAL